MLVRDGDRTVAPERGPSGEELVEHHAGGIQVRAGVDRFALGLLGGEVRCGAENGAGLGHRGGGVRCRAGDAEVHDLDPPGVGDHHVAGLDVAVHDTGPVGVLQRFEDAVDVPHRLIGSEGAGGQDRLQGASLHEFHHDERLGPRPAVCPDDGVLAGVIDPDHGGVGHAGRGLRLLAEPGAEHGVIRQFAAQDLQRHHAVEGRVVAAVDARHAAAADEFVEAVTASEQARLTRHDVSLDATPASLSDGAPLAWGRADHPPPGGVGAGSTVAWACGDDPESRVVPLPLPEQVTV